MASDADLCGNGSSALSYLAWLSLYYLLRHTCNDSSEVYSLGKYFCLYIIVDEFPLQILQPEMLTNV